MYTGLCGMRLNTAGVVIGWIGAALSLISVIIFSVCLARVDDLTQLIMEHMKNSNITEENIRAGIVVLSIMYITINIINMVASALLVAGTVKERHLLIVPWLINSGFSLLFSAIYFVYGVISAIALHVAFGSIAVSLISSGITLFLQYIVWYTVYSLFKKIQGTREQQQHLVPSSGSSYPIYSKI